MTRRTRTRRRTAQRRGDGGVRYPAVVVFLITSALGVLACGGSEKEAAGGSFQQLSFSTSESPGRDDSSSGPDPALWETPLDDAELERGRDIWRGTCITCHSTGLGGAPLIGDVDLWEPRLAKGESVLLQHALEGFYGDQGEMPARGGNETLSDEDVRAALRFMTSRVARGA